MGAEGVVLADNAGYYATYTTVLLVVLAGAAFAAVAFGANRMLRPTRPTREKLLTYESGVDPVGEGWAQAHVRYYVFAYLYVVFAVDAIYLFPWATVFALRASAGPRWWRCSSSSGSSRSVCSTRGARGCWCGRDVHRWRLGRRLRRSGRPAAAHGRSVDG